MGSGCVSRWGWRPRGVRSAGLCAGLALLGGAVGGIPGAPLGEFFGRSLPIHGDARVGPPVFAILGRRCAW